MANEEHLDILRQGVDSWNQWREENPDIRPDLGVLRARGHDFRQFDLRYAYLRAVDFTGAQLDHAKLDSADLSGNASFSGATFVDAGLDRVNANGANLSNARFHAADLSSADFARANLNNADLMGAFLFNTIFRRTELEGTNFDGAEFGGTMLANLDLSPVVGLDSCFHRGPSSIDHRTLSRSDGVSIRFLRGCGLPDEWIEYLPALIGRAIQYYSCFVSYSSLDDEFAKRLHADLQDNGVRCWFAPEDMKIGDKIRAKIDESIRMYDKLLLVLSEKLVTSEWVEKEVETAFEKERKSKKTCLFPVRLDEAVLETDEAWAADIRRKRHIGDFRDWKDHDAYQKAFERLLRDLKRPSS